MRKRCRTCFISEGGIVSVNSRLRHWNRGGVSIDKRVVGSCGR